MDEYIPVSFVGPNRYIEYGVIASYIFVIIMLIVAVSIFKDGKNVTGTALGIVSAWFFWHVWGLRLNNDYIKSNKIHAIF